MFVLGDNGESLPQNNLVHSDYTFVKSFNRFSETSRAFDFWESMTNLLLSGCYEHLIAVKVFGFKLCMAINFNCEEFTFLSKQTSNNIHSRL